VYWVKPMCSVYFPFPCSGLIFGFRFEDLALFLGHYGTAGKRMFRNAMFGNMLILVFKLLAISAGANSLNCEYAV
jgi:hypothetical protein